jgi:hypothetical protein
MSDFEEKLNSVLSNPDAMSQIMNLAQSLNLGGGGGESPQGGQGGGSEPPSPSPPAGGGDGLGGLAGLGSLLGQIDPKWINRLLPLVGELTGGGSDERMQLLYALRPFLKPERQDKVERAAKTARLIHMGKKLLQSMGESDV